MNRESLKQAVEWFRTHRFLFLLNSILLLIFLVPFSVDSELGNWLIVFSLTMVIFACVFTLIEKRWVFILASILMFAIISDFALYLIFKDENIQLMQHGLSIIFYVLAISLVATKAMSGTDITLETVLASLSVYLLIALTYGHAYALIENLIPNSFYYNPDICKNCLTDFDLVYFSFTTLTTVGFGEILPVTIAAKSIVMLEQVTGVLYLAAIVSRLVAGLRLRI